MKGLSGGARVVLDCLQNHSWLRVTLRAIGDASGTWGALWVGHLVDQNGVLSPVPIHPSTFLELKAAGEIRELDCDTVGDRVGWRELGLDGQFGWWVPR
jgi:hypothetical protein